MQTRYGTVACGHPETASAAIAVLEAGGNAFDAALAALCAAFTAEPVLASLGGGGFLLAAPADEAPVLYDFFCQTPGHPPADGNVDFHPIHADFGTTAQEFHIGRAAVAVPGVPAGLFAVHRDHCRLPLAQVLEPGIRLARRGVALNAFHADVFRIVAPIYRASASARHAFRPAGGPDRLPVEGETLCLPGLADTLEALAREGEALFYRGEIAHTVADFCREGGLLCETDLATYRVERRTPLRFRYRDVGVVTNPLPSSGGVLIAFGLGLLQAQQIREVHPQTLARVMALTARARIEAGLDDPAKAHAEHLLEPGTLARYAAALEDRAWATRGTTHISVIDTAGNAAALTVSNGEGCGEMLGGTGIMLNNMLGEEDLNPRGFHRWTPATRMTSMMAPTLLQFPGTRGVVLGSGGSNRIRTALLQVIVRLVDEGLPLAEAVHAPRIHVENDLLSVEPGLPGPALQALLADWPQHELWDVQSLFFGGVHAVERDGTTLSGAGDARRSGASRSA